MSATTRVLGGRLGALITSRAASFAGQRAAAASGARSFVAAAGPSAWHSTPPPSLLAAALHLQRTPAGLVSPWAALPGSAAWAELAILVPMGPIGVPVVAPTGLGSVGEEGEVEGLEMMNRNARVPKKPNHGARPCSHYGRKRRAKARKPLKGR
ncbi:hypothetical protein T484DRAFT_1841023 [Baffinella frigidus]|nr:hypothetical protein T484DRAFT_1841023 [Cryptophyta sp. CCMP2293]